MEAKKQEPKKELPTYAMSGDIPDELQERIVDFENGMHHLVLNNFTRADLRWLRKYYGSSKIVSEIERSLEV